ncbi:MAG: hypothetical protein R6W78_02080 [Bacteroidales bacterium]
MTSRELSNPYIIINLTFIVILLLLFLYFLIYSPESKYPVNSNYSVLTGKESISSGLSRSFSSALRFEFKEAKDHNPYGIRIFGFFFIQLVLRTIFVITALKTDKNTGLITLADVIISLSLFAVCFSPFIIEAFGKITGAWFIFIFIERYPKTIL